jgi:endonuclease-3
MRKLTTAAVDTMGCHTFMDTEISPQTARFHVFVACLLSSQTRDEITHAALGRLIALNGLTPEAICEMKEKDLADILNPVGFRNRKAGYLKAACAQFVEDGGEIPRTMEDLVALKGIGPKMANLVMTVAWGVCQGICVDIHVHRITNRLRWVKTWTKAKNEGPIKTEAALEDFIPREMWEDINGTIVGFGQTICKPVLPNCDQCTLAEICPSKKKLWKPRELRSSPKKKAKKN